MSITLPITDHGENKKNLCNNDNTHIVDRWDLKAWDEIQNSSLSISFSNSWTPSIKFMCMLLFTFNDYFCSIFNLVQDMVFIRGINDFTYYIYRRVCQIFSRPHLLELVNRINIMLCLQANMQHPIHALLSLHWLPLRQLL